MYLLKEKGDNSIKTPEDMEGKVVGTQTSCYNETDTKAFNKKLISKGGKGYKALKTYDGFPDAYMELKNGKLDIVAQNYASSAALVKIIRMIMSLFRMEKAMWQW